MLFVFYFINFAIHITNINKMGATASDNIQYTFILIRHLEATQWWVCKAFSCVALNLI